MGYVLPAGPSLIDSIWEELDVAVANLMTAPGKVFDATLNVYKGQALGLATALAILTNPYAKDIDAIRLEAMARYNQKGKK